MEQEMRMSIDKVVRSIEMVRGLEKVREVTRLGICMCS